MKKLVTLMIILFISAPSQATNQSGKNKIKTCTICHGVDGMSDNPDHFPSLYGKSAAQIAKALREFRSGERKNKMMEQATRNLTDEEITSLADYYGNIK